MPDLTTVALGDATVTLQPPASFSACYDVLASSGTNALRAMAAALGMCWRRPAPRPASEDGAKRPSIAPPRARYEASYSPLAYGGEVIDDLVKRGFTMPQIQAAALAAYQLVAAATVNKSEVEDVEGNSGAPEGSAISP